MPQAQTACRGLDRTPVLSRDDRFFLTREACDQRDYSDEPPLSWANLSPGTQLEGPALKGAGNAPSPYPRLMKPRFPDPLSPSGDASSKSPFLQRLSPPASGETRRDVSMTTAAGRKKPVTPDSIPYFAVYSKLCYSPGRK